MVYTFIVQRTVGLQVTIPIHLSQPLYPVRDSQNSQGLLSFRHCRLID